MLSWNIHANCGIHTARLDRVITAIAAFDADIVLLQEVYVHGGVHERLRSELAPAGWYFSGNDTSDNKYGNVIASRYPVRARHFETSPEAPWRQLLACATVDLPTGAIEVISAHMPNGAKHGWKKIETFEALASILEQVAAQPWIVGGDFNEPMTVLPDNRVVSFGADEDGEVVGTWRGQPNARWQAAVETILGPTETSVHAWLSRNAGVTAATHMVGRQDRFFDHLLASTHFEIGDAGFEHAWREGSSAMSDHSAAWMSVTLRSLKDAERVANPAVTKE